MAAMLAGILLITGPLLGILVTATIALLLLLLGTLLLPVALPGLQIRQAGRSRRLGRAGVILATIGVLTFVSFIAFNLTMDTFFGTYIGGWADGVAIVTGGVALLGFAVFGIAMVGANVLPRWAAVMFALGLPLGIGGSLLISRLFPEAINAPLVPLLAGLGVFAVGLIRLGYALWARARLKVKLSKRLPELSRPYSLRPRMPRTGFSDKTVWDWLQLLIVPIMLAIASFWFTLQQDTRQQALEEQRAQDLVLQAYLDKIGQLMLVNKLRTSKEGSEVRTLARSRTLAVLERMDPTRERHVMQFLTEAKLVQEVNGSDPVIELGGADLSGAGLANLHLSGANLSDADLSGANLSDADLSGAKLDHADLSGVDLFGAELYGGANLSDAKLNDADLSGANLSDANLFDANLSGGDLRGAKLGGAALDLVNLVGADLTNAKGITWRRAKRSVAFVSTECATMPDGKIKTGHWVGEEFEPSLAVCIPRYVWQSSRNQSAAWVAIENQRGKIIFTNPLQVFDPGNPSSPNDVPAPKNIDNWVSWFQKHPNLKTSKPVAVSVGGAPGMQIDVSATNAPKEYSRELCGRETCVPLFPSGDNEIVSYADRKDRFIIVNVGDETVIIDLSAQADDFDYFTEYKTGAVLHTVRWNGEH